MERVETDATNRSFEFFDLEGMTAQQIVEKVIAFDCDKVTIVNAHGERTAVYSFRNEGEPLSGKEFILVRKSQERRREE